MTKVIKCSRCKHKLPKKICGFSQSPYFNEKIQPTGSCDFFLENPAQDHFSEGLKKGFKTTLEGTTQENVTEVVRQFETAIELGLPHDDEMEARFFLGEGYADLVNSEPTIEEMVATREFSETINQMEKAVLMDAEGAYGYFLEPLNRTRLKILDHCYTMMARSIREKEGIHAAITYLKQKLQLFDYLKSSPMLYMLLDLGAIYAEQDERELARESFKKIIDADPVDPVDKTGDETKTRKRAENNLEVLESRDAKESKCLIATAVYCTPYVPEVKLLKEFRDKLILSNVLGQLAIAIYYHFSPSVARFIKRSEIAKLLARLIIVRPALSIARICLSCSKKR